MELSTLSLTTVVGWQVTDAVFTNSIAKVSLLGAHDLATPAGQQPNATFKAIADGTQK